AGIRSHDHLCGPFWKCAECLFDCIFGISTPLRADQFEDHLFLVTCELGKAIKHSKSTADTRSQMRTSPTGCISRRKLSTQASIESGKTSNSAARRSLSRETRSCESSGCR